MLEDYAVDILSKLSTAFSLPIRHYHQDMLLHNWSSRSFSVDLAKLYTEPYVKHGIPLYSVVSPQYLLSGRIALPDSREYLILGPALPHEMASTQCISVLEEFSLPPQQMEELKFYFHFLPQMTVERFNIALELVWTIIYPNPEAIPQPTVFDTDNRNAIKTSGIEVENMMNADAEHTMLSIIGSGRVDKLEDALQHIYSSSDFGLSRLAPSQLRALKNTIISSVSLVSRKAVECGIDYSTSLAVSDHYIYRLEQTDSISGAKEIWYTMLVDYTQRVAALHTPGNTTPLTAKIFRDIQAHKYEKITVSDIARRLSFSPGYLSHHFKEATGVTLSDYIHEQKIAEAGQLLENTELSLAEIAAKMGFSSQQQFQQIFRKIAGETPAAYRRRKKK